jgi:hypothetical protein
VCAGVCAGVCVWVCVCVGVCVVCGVCVCVCLCGGGDALFGIRLGLIPNSAYAATLPNYPH